MKKALFSTAAIVALAASMQAAETASEEGLKVDGEIRSFYISRDVESEDTGVNGDYNRNSLAIGGNLGVTKKCDIEGLSLAARFYTTQPLGGQQPNDSTKDPRMDLTLFNSDGEGYSILGEAYVNYAAGKTNVKVGRQALSTPLAAGDDVRMLPTLFEAAVVSNSDITNTTLIAAHVGKVAYGTFSNVYTSSINVLNLTGGYGANHNVGEFQNMGYAAIGEHTNGVDALAAIYHDKDLGLKLQVWDYIATDILNAIYAEANYDLKLGDNKLFVGAQHISEKETGDNRIEDATAGTEDKINGSYSAFKLGGTFGPLTASVATSQTAIITPWGGMPAYTQGMVTRHMFFADTKATKVAATYKEGSLKATFAHVVFDMGKNNSYSTDYEWTSTEEIADIIYMANKDLMLRYRMNMPHTFYESATKEVGWTEHRVIVSYKF